MILLYFESLAKGAVPMNVSGTSRDPRKMTKALAAEYKRRGLSLDDDRAQLVQEAGDLMLQALRHEAPRKTGKFADGFQVETRKTYTFDDMLRIEAKGEHAFLLNYIVKGTKAHEIPKGGALAQMAKGYPLRFYWENGPGGPGIYYFWSVMHPGTQPDNFIQRAMDAEMPTIRAAFQDLMMKVRGGSTVV